MCASPGSYRRLLELNAQDPLALSPIAGLTVVIDEVLPETEVMSPDEPLYCCTA
jgi:hypothetical protein